MGIIHLGREMTFEKSSATRRWGHWSSVNLSSDIWNSLDISLREAESSNAFKRGSVYSYLMILDGF